MRMGREFAARNRLRIVVVIVFATISYWLATVAAAIATALTLVVIAIFKAEYVPDSIEELKFGGIGLLVVIALAAVIGSLIALYRLPMQRRRLERQVLTETSATIATGDEQIRVRNLLEGLAIAANVPAPRFAIIDDPAPNSFSVGTKPKTTIVAVTSGLIESLSRDELEAVLAYEVSRIGSRDIALASWTVALTGGAINAVDSDSDDGFFRGVLGFIPRVFAQWLQVYAMKGQIEERDRIAINFTRNPEALVRALEKLYDDHSEIGRVTRATAPLWIELPVIVGGTSRFGLRLAQEVALDDRIRDLRELAGLPAI
jgi:heat shock protein HtpX